MIDTVTISQIVHSSYYYMYECSTELSAKAMGLTGMLSKVETIIHMPLAVTAAFGAVLVPTISSLIAKGDKKEAERKLTFSFFATILIIIPAAVGLAVISEPILHMLYPRAPEGAGILALTTITMIFVSLNVVVNGGLFGLGRVIIPVISLIVGGVVKLILNVVLISNPNIGVYGATIGSIVCQGIAFTICFIALNKHIKLQISFKNHILKPVIAAGVMGAGVYGVYTLMHTIAGNTVSTLVAMAAGVVIYSVAIIFTRALSKDDIYMIPFGTKIYPVLVRMGVYK